MYGNMAKEDDAYSAPVRRAFDMYYMATSDLEKEHLKADIASAVDSGSHEASVRLAVIELGEKQRAGVERLKKLADQNYAPALYELGNVYYFGFDGLLDKRFGADCWQRASELGHIFARLNYLMLLATSKRFFQRMVLLTYIWWTMVFAIYTAAGDIDDQRLLVSFPNYPGYRIFKNLLIRFMVRR